MSGAVFGIVVGIGMAVALLAWAAFDIGVVAVARYREAFTQRAHFSLRELFLFVDPTHLFIANIALILLAGIGVWVASGLFLLGVAAAVGAAILPRLILRKLRERRLHAIEQQLPDALLVIAGGLRAGVSLSHALQQLVRETRPPVSQEFELVLREQRLGVALDQSLENLARRVPLQSVTLFVSAMRIANETGGSLAEALERAAQTLRSKIAMEGKIRALTAQGKLQAWVVGLLPVFLFLALSKLEPAAMSLLWTTRMGWGTIAVVVLLEFFGVVLIRKIVAIDV
ncbi:type II secretion system F family protein [Thiobacter aerophilum]|uniref:Type II secretion system F family protein n=1 Tax=Thiobacter aerophilum TaxID=3121275 RepID=A0ABV0EGK5_9BURK